MPGAVTICYSKGMEMAQLTAQEVSDLVLTILEGVDAAEGGEPLRDTWAHEMRDWAFLLLSRSHGEAP